MLRRSPTRPVGEDDRHWRGRALPVVALLTSFLVAAFLLAGCGSGTPAPNGDGSTEQGDGQAVELDIVGKDVQFDTSTLQAPADTPFTVVFDNRDDGIPHNIAIYATDAAQELLAGTEVANGPVVQRLDVDGLPAGEYFYRCDVHPQTMTGTLDVG